VPSFAPGDYNQNGVVDTADYTVWRNTLGQTGVTPHSGADGDGDGDITRADYTVWKTHFGDLLAVSPPGAGSGGVACPLSAHVAASLRDVHPNPRVAERLDHLVHGVARPKSATSEAEPASRGENPPPQPAPRASLDATRRRSSRLPLAATPTPSSTAHDDALVAWLASRGDTRQPSELLERTETLSNEAASPQRRSTAFLRSCWET
jgi:hypothetical protein